MKPALPARQSGTSLLLALLIATAVGFGFFFFAPAPPSDAGKRNAATEATLAEAKAALIGYAATYRETHSNEFNLGYLPCPDLDNTGTAAPNCDNAGIPVAGRLPYKTLGLPPLRSSDGECLWYIVAGTHKNNPKAPPLNWDRRSVLRIVDSKGQTLADPDADDGGPVAVLIAPGAPLPGQNRPGGSFDCTSGVPQDVTAQVAHYIDAFDATAQRLALPAAGPASSTRNDRANWISARELYATVAKRNDLLGTLTTELQTCLDGTDSSSVPTDAMLYSSVGNKRVISPAGLTATVTRRACALTPATLDLLSNWADQFRYVVCAPADTPCLKVDGVDCSGALLFAGKLPRGPRNAAELAAANDLFDSGNIAALTQVTPNTLLTTSTTPPVGAIYQGLRPERDLAFCLRPASAGSELSFARNFDNLTTAAADIDGERMVRLDAARRVLQLGAEGITGNNADVNPALLFGCSWFSTPLAFKSGLRAYFRYRILNRGEGFVFTLADATRNPDTLRCGRGDSSLGYSGLPNNGGDIPGLSLQAIQPPKIGLEIDTRQTLARGDNNRNHIAIVYWGDTMLPDDDNVHYAPLTPIAGTPSNPAPVTRTIANDRDVNLHVRLEIVRTRATGSSTYTFKAWLLDFLPSGFDDLNTPFDEDIEPAQLRTSASIADLAPNEEALRTIRLGFTNAASASADQLIEISNFAVLTQP